MTTSLNKPSSQEGLKPVAWRYRDNDMMDDEWFVSEYHPSADMWDTVEPLYTRHPSFNEAIEAAAKCCDQIRNNAERRAAEHENGEARNSALDKMEGAIQCAAAIRSLKLPDYRGGKAG